MPKRKKWETLNDAAKIEELHRQVLDLAGAIQTVRLDLAHIVSQLSKAASRKK